MAHHPHYPVGGHFHRSIHEPHPQYDLFIETPLITMQTMPSMCTVGSAARSSVRSLGAAMDRWRSLSSSVLTTAISGQVFYIFLVKGGVRVNHTVLGSAIVNQRSRDLPRRNSIHLIDISAVELTIL